MDTLISIYNMNIAARHGLTVLNLSRKNQKQ